MDGGWHAGDADFLRLCPRPCHPRAPPRKESLAEGTFLAVPGAARAGSGGARAFLLLRQRGVIRDPFEVCGHQRPGGGAALGHGPLALRHELHAHGPHLLLEVEVRLLLHALAVQRVAEGAQPVQAHRLALAHVVGHHARQLAQYGHHVGVGHGAHLAQPLGHLLHGHRLAHHHGAGVPHAELLIVDFSVITHDVNG